MAERCILELLEEFQHLQRFLELLTEVVPSLWISSMSLTYVTVLTVHAREDCRHRAARAANPVCHASLTMGRSSVIVTSKLGAR